MNYCKQNFVQKILYLFNKKNNSNLFIFFSMLDDFAHEMNTTESKMDNVMKKMAKVLHMSNGKNCFFFVTKT